MIGDPLGRYIDDLDDILRASSATWAEASKKRIEDYKATVLKGGASVLELSTKGTVIQMREDAAAHSHERFGKSKSPFQVSVSGVAKLMERELDTLITEEALRLNTPDIVPRYHTVRDALGQTPEAALEGLGATLIRTIPDHAQENVFGRIGRWFSRSARAEMDKNQIAEAAEADDLFATVRKGLGELTEMALKAYSSWASAVLEGLLKRIEQSVTASLEDVHQQFNERLEDRRDHLRALQVAKKAGEEQLAMLVSKVVDRRARAEERRSRVAEMLREVDALERRIGAPQVA